MRFLLKMKLKKPSLPKDYHPLIVSIFKGCIAEHSDQKIYQSLYEPGANKSLSWAIKFSKPIFDKDVIQLDSTSVNVTLNITDQKTALVYFSSLVASVGKQIPVAGDNTLIIKSIKILPEKQIHSNFVQFNLFSPLCLREHDKVSNKDYYYTVEDEKFVGMFKEALATSITEKNKQYLDQVEFDISGLKKIIVLLYSQKIAVSIGSFMVKAPTEVLNDIYQNGLGVRQPSGFGLLGIVAEGGEA